MSVTDIENMKIVIYEDGTTDYDRMIEELAGGWDHYGLLWLRMRINMLHLDVYANRELIKDLIWSFGVTPLSLSFRFRQWARIPKLHRFSLLEWWRITNL